MGPDTCPRQHFAWATTVRWEDAFPAKLNPCLQWAYDQQQTFGPKLAQWRQAVVEDITGFVQELAEDQEAWLATAPFVKFTNKGRQATSSSCWRFLTS